MRSIPPASSHLAESPVPAPPPMIGSPRRIMARNFFRQSCRGIRGIGRLTSPGPGYGRSADDLVEGGHQGVAEGLIVDVVRKTQELSVGAHPKAGGDGVEQGPVSRRIPERLA